MKNADKWFSLFIRLRDADLNGTAQCCTCGTRKEVKFMDCGHFIKRQHKATRFSEVNCACQCKKCNAFEQGRNEDFERYLIERYGKERVDLLKFQGTQTKKLSKFELIHIADYYKIKAKELSKEKGIPLW